MPTYDYKCEACEHIFESFQHMSKLDEPCSEPCPKCEEMKVRRAYLSAPAGASDSTLTPDKATGGQWSELMGRIKKSGLVPKRYHDGLDQASSRTGRRWSG